MTPLFQLVLDVGVIALLLIACVTWLLVSAIIRSSVENKWLDFLSSVFVLALIVLALAYFEPRTQTVTIFTALGASLWGVKKYWNGDNT